MPKRYLKPTLRTTEQADLQRAIDKIYDDLNNLADAVVKPSDETASRTGGKAGEIRAINDRATGSVVIQARTDKGWMEVARKAVK